ncbi:competence protein CoiA family protein [Cellvibrio mixtus]|uniref:competence protein CoiA family protein n=1 Tax=Cellvibrio mixtus TaxID=39650 RepID=UPI000586C8CD|nr:competence protein CoiA family protein [Cellvibrio mixtus]
MNSAKLGWGLHASGRMRHIEMAERGKKCDCVCPDCGSPLIAKKGDQVVWHFAHAVPIECNGESALHRAAKQVIEDAATNHFSILLPEISGTVSQQDIRRRHFEGVWSVPSRLAEISAASQEVRIRSDLIADVLAICDQQEVAIEICVTNRKTEVEQQKYEAADVSCIEIMLFDMKWNASVELIEEAVLRSASRCWIHCVHARYRIDAARVDLNQKIQDQIRDEAATFDGFCSLIMDSEIKQLNLLNWPILKAKFSQTSDSSITTVEVSETPKITKFLDVCSRFNGIIESTGIVNNKIPVGVYFILDGIDISTISIGSPSLIISVDINEFESVSLEKCGLTWVGIDRWIDKLNAKAVEKYQKRENQRLESEKRIDSFAEYFIGLNNLEKLAFIANKLNISPPSYIGPVVFHWNTTWSIWKGLVWYYYVFKKKEEVVYLSSIAECKWLSRLLSWSDTSESINKRQKDLWFWFKDLESIGLVGHEGAQFFNVSKMLPKKFVPWEKIKVK